MRLSKKVVTGFIFTAVLAILPGLASAGRLLCPDNPGDLHPRDIMATSAPEIKVRAANQEDSRKWAQIIKPLTQKAIKLAKAQRAAAMQEGIESACNSSEQYVGQLVPAPDRPSGCDHKIVTRPADAEHIFVQSIAVCKYTWSCCIPEDGKPAQGASGNSAGVGYTMEGPLSGNPPASSTTTPKQKR